MIEKGFEYAYMYGEPRNADSRRYRVVPKCCKVWTVDLIKFKFLLMQQHKIRHAFTVQAE